MSKLRRNRHAEFNRHRGAGFLRIITAGQAFFGRKDVTMDEKRNAPDHGETADKDEQATEQGARNREKLDEIPEPGTDPLHEGP
jgi:hypothetical protein